MVKVAIIGNAAAATAFVFNMARSPFSKTTAFDLPIQIDQEVGVWLRVTPAPQVAASKEKRPVALPYSVRILAIGSTLEARPAGMQMATTATRRRIPTTAARVIGSVASTL